MLPDLLSIGRAFAFLLLALAPGAYITFGLALESLPFWARLFTAGMLSPLVVLFEFYAVRLAGLSPDATPIALVLLNVPALFLIWKSRRPARLSRGQWLLAFSAVIVPTLCMVHTLLYKDVRIFSPHAWIYSDPIYMLAKGMLIPEDPILAGVRLSYPVWSGLVFQAVESSILASPPMYNFVWVNLVLLILTYGFAIGIVKELGGHMVAQACAGILLLIGTNPVGYILMQINPSRFWWVDVRFTPWVRKFFIFSTMPIALGMIAAMIYLLVRDRKCECRIQMLLAALLTGAGILYPLLFPSACALIGAKMLAVVFEQWRGSSRFRLRPLVPWMGMLLVAAGAVAWQLHFTQIDRSADSASILLTPIRGMLRKTGASIISTLVLLTGFAVVAQRQWRKRPEIVIVLAATAAANYFLYIAADIKYWWNEYKFIFIVAMCLAPFASLAVEHICDNWPRWQARAVLGIAGLIVLGAYLHGAHRMWHFVKRSDRPVTDVSAFPMRLETADGWGKICESVRTGTPANTVLVSNNEKIYLPTFTWRAMYVSPLDRAYDGVTIGMDDLDEGVRGNSRRIVEGRRSDLKNLFEGSDPRARDEAFQRIEALGRPIAVILEPRHSALLEWMKSNGKGSAITHQDGLTLWLIESPPGRKSI
jgi:hypothetical protein